MTNETNAGPLVVGSTAGLERLADELHEAARSDSALQFAHAKNALDEAHYNEHMRPALCAAIQRLRAVWWHDGTEDQRQAVRVAIAALGQALRSNVALIR